MFVITNENTRVYLGFPAKKKIIQDFQPNHGLLGRAIGTNSDGLAFSMDLVYIYIKELRGPG